MLVKEQTNIRLYCYDRKVDDIFAGLEIVTGNIDIKDVISDPCGWESSNNLTPNLMSTDIISQQLLSFKGVVFLHSITPLLVHNGINDVYRSLHKILKENSDMQLVALMHSDVHDPLESDIIEKLASTVLTTSVEKNNLVSTIYFSSGKVSNQLVEFKVSPHYEFEILRDVDIQLKLAPAKQPDPTKNLPFNLKLKENEKEARSQLQLPYMKMQTNDDTIIQSVLENDYYDEDDPDDDLDI